jgi:hypothetical protein
MSGNRLLKAADEVLTALATADIPACLIGALAVHRWGEARATRDVDVSVLAPYGEEVRVLDLLLTRFAARRPDARAFALDHRVLLGACLQSSKRIPISFVRSKIFSGR